MFPDLEKKIEYLFHTKAFWGKILWGFFLAFFCSNTNNLQIYSKYRVITPWWREIWACNLSTHLNTWSLLFWKLVTYPFSKAALQVFGGVRHPRRLSVSIYSSRGRLLYLILLHNFVCWSFFPDSAPERFMELLAVTQAGMAVSWLFANSCVPPAGMHCPMDVTLT